MKLPFILFCLIIQCNIYAQSKNILKLNGTDLIVGRYSIGYEKNIGHSMSIALDLDILNQNKILESSHPWYPPLDVTKKGIVVEPQIRYYFNNKELEGLYTSLSGVFGVAEYQPTTPSGFIENDDWSSLGVSLSLGYQLLIKRIALDGFLGCTIADDDYPRPYIESTVLFPPPNGLRVSGGVKIGLCF